MDTIERTIPTQQSSTRGRGKGRGRGRGRGTRGGTKATKSRQSQLDITVTTPVAVSDTQSTTAKKTTKVSKTMLTLELTSLIRTLRHLYNQDTFCRSFYHTYMYTLV